MHKIRFTPWMGEQFLAAREERESRSRTHSSRGLPFHLLGESHYAEPDEDESGITQRIVRDCGFEAGRHSRFFAGALQVATGHALSEIDRPDAWDRLAFSNYVQHLLPETRMAPDKVMWDYAGSAFIEQLQHVRAPNVVVLGWRLWEHLPSRGGIQVGPLQDPTIAGRSDVESAWAYEYDTSRGRRVSLAVPVTHPSGRGFNWQEAHDRVQVAAHNYCNVLSDFEERWNRERMA